MAATKTGLAVPPSQGRSVSIDHTFNEPRSIGALMGDLERALSTMRPDDLSLEIDSHTDRERSSTRVRFRAYRHRSGT